MEEFVGFLCAPSVCPNQNFTLDFVFLGRLVFELTQMNFLMMLIQAFAGKDSIYERESTSFVLAEGRKKSTQKFLLCEIRAIIFL